MSTRQTRSELPRLEEMETLNRRIAALPKVPSPQGQIGLPDEHSMLYSQRGALRADLGIAEGGLLDCLRGHLGQVDANLPALLENYRVHIKDYLARPAAVHAHTGEALRVYTRDVLLNQVGGLRHAQEILKASIASFENAITRLPQGSDDLIRRQKAWILAHQGAARVLMFWLSFIREDEDEDSFQAALHDFEEAQKAAPKYNWCMQFKAFLLALHGKGDEFARARDMLAELEHDARLDPAIHRSRAMLDTYIAADETNSSEIRKEAARVAIDSGLTAARLDSEEHRALYYVAVARWQYMRLEEEDRANATGHAHAKGSSGKPQDAPSQALPAAQTRDHAQDLEDLQQSIESAELRSQNQLSQTLTALVGLALLRGMTSKSEKERTDAFAAANRLSALWDDVIPADLETQAMFARDPLFRRIRLEKDTKEDCGHAWRAHQPNFDHLRKRYAAR